MICIIAGNKDEAQTWASGQNLSKDEWFYPKNEEELLSRNNFHTLVIGTAGLNIQIDHFERIYTLAKIRGRVGRF